MAALSSEDDRAPVERGALYICPTPLGNLRDMTPRALDALAAADTVCAEDTRVTGKLLAAFGIRARLERLDEASIAAKAQGVVDRVAAGETIAYCSDAGMPGVSDPGQRLTAVARAAGVPVVVLPGPTATATAYVASGFTCPRFYFGGFFPRKAGEQDRTLASLASLDAVLVFYESPRRAAAALAAIARAFPQRRVALCRELTKVHEEVIVEAAPDLARMIAARTEAGEMRGECAIVIDAPGAGEAQAAEAEAEREAQARAAELLAQGDLTKKDVVRALRDEFGLKRNDAYDLVYGAGEAGR